MIVNPQKPTENALYFAELFMMNAFDRLDAQKANATRASDALTKLRSALSGFQAALTGLSSAGGMIKYQGVLSNTNMGTVSVGSSAQPGSYAFFVEQLATSHQLSVQGIPAVPVDEAGTLVVELGHGESFEVDLTDARADADGNLTSAEMARAINEAVGNRGKVSASVVTVNGEQQLVLSSGQAGTEGEISLNTNGIGHAGLRNALDGANEMTAARNAVFYIGGEGGTRVEQSANTFTGIQGVSVTFTQAMNAGDPALMLTISRDGSSTEENVKSFVDAYNALKKILDDLAYAGNGTPGSAGPMAGDAGIRTLQQRLSDMLRQSVEGQKLLDFGISTDRTGVLKFDTVKFNEALAADPAALDKLFGDSSTGLLGKFEGYLDSWLSTTNGQIQSRQDSMEKIQDQLSKRETALEAQYTRVYERYLHQFNRLYVIDAQMNYTLDLLEALKPDTGKK
ncbi:flagellar filament capping protein FliD [Dyella sp. M7H15-1]|uniref:flagellar filament capping protein FliD n=1 Tax=Dyella sp. M7H15-1 TaxID=2501295 RepID=UPI0013E8A1DD|nr:flagellar filament capping protein FliD [Dyella sp. M7H15-1]